MTRSHPLLAHTHRRRNPLTGEWVLVSPHRLKRPWNGATESSAKLDKPRFDPECYLCPGNQRVGKEKNPAYAETFVFTNDFSALQPDTPGNELDLDPLLRATSEQGSCRVICFSPRHDLTLAQMDAQGIKKVVDVWVEEYRRLHLTRGLGYVQIFENKGSMMGASNPHPHGQIWAQRSIPGLPARESVTQLEYFRTHGRTMLADYLSAEDRFGDRMVASNDHFAALVPFWAVWPFETLVISRRPMENIVQLKMTEREAFAEIIRQVTVRYDNLFCTSFPYSAGIHQSPTDGKPHPEWHVHMHFLPPLLRSATIRKFMVGYEMLAEPQRDIPPELSAELLRRSPDVHYLNAATSQPDVVSR